MGMGRVPSAVAVAVAGRGGEGEGASARRGLPTVVSTTALQTAGQPPSVPTTALQPRGLPCQLDGACPSALRGFPVSLAGLARRLGHATRIDASLNYTCASLTTPFTRAKFLS
jgi:hypothetical protein